eukprot:m.334781 g.334781  ORF g.334781 m.334781 type:complete len:287 (-) comp16074_c0_seq10:328-1188(-)
MLMNLNASLACAVLLVIGLNGVDADCRALNIYSSDTCNDYCTSNFYVGSHFTTTNNVIECDCVTSSVQYQFVCSETVATSTNSPTTSFEHTCRNMGVYDSGDCTFACQQQSPFSYRAEASCGSSGCTCKCNGNVLCSDSSSGGSISLGLIVGIVIVVLGLLGGCAFFLLARKRKASATPYVHMDVPGVTAHNAGLQQGDQPHDFINPTQQQQQQYPPAPQDQQQQYPPAPQDQQQQYPPAPQQNQPPAFGGAPQQQQYPPPQFQPPVFGGAQPNYPSPPMGDSSSA